MWRLTKDITVTLVDPVLVNPIISFPECVSRFYKVPSHFYEMVFEPVLEYLEAQLPKLIAEPFETLKSELTVYGNQMLEELNNANAE